MAFVAAAAPSPCTLARVRVMETSRSSCAACRAAPMVHSFPKSITFLIASASRLPAVAPFTIEAVIPSMPCEAPRAAFVAVASIFDRLVLTLLMDWFALSTSMVTTSSSLLSAMGIDALLIQPLALLFEDQHGVELVGADLIE